MVPFVTELLADPHRPYTPEEVLAKHLDQPRTGAPGERFTFSQADTVALGLIIQRELGLDLGTIIADRITVPLSLDDTILSDPTTPRETRHGWYSLDASPPTLDALDFPIPAVATSRWPNSAVSSSKDMLDWTEALFSGAFLGADTTAAMNEMRSSWVVSPIVHYGLGASGYCLDVNGCAPAEVDLVGQQGNFGGSATRIGYHLASGTSIVLHTNVSPMDAAPFITLAGELLAKLGVDA